VLQMLRKRPSTRYIFASSGVATGHDFKTPRAPDSPLRRPAWNDFYARAKADAEARHRESRDLSIVDLRLYSFYSADMGAELGYLVCSIMNMLQIRSPLIADQHDIARDYLHPGDLSSAIMAVLGSPPVNAAYDLASLKPARKLEMLRRFQEQFALHWEIRPSNVAPNKMNYYSEDLSLRKCGFAPAFSALEAVIDQATTFLARSDGMPQLGRN
jgi:nucleoside-diphosphate-sugar epimerase